MAFEGEDARRWQMTDAPTLLPAVDFVTRSPNGPFLDTGINLTVESKGRVYLSVETIREMAEIAGILETHNAQEKKLHETEIYNTGYRDGLKEGNELVERLTTIGGFIAPHSGGAAVPDLEVAPKPAKAAGNRAGKSDSSSDDVQATAK